MANSPAFPMVAESKKADARRRQDDRFFPDVPALFVGQVVGFVQDDKIRAHVLAGAQRVEKLVAVDFGSADDQRRIGIFLPVAGQNADVIRAELQLKLDVFRIGQGFQRRRVPGFLSRRQQAADFFARNPGLAAAGRRRNQNVFCFNSFQRFKLKIVRLKRARLGGSDAGKQLVQRPALRFTRPSGSAGVASVFSASSLLARRSLRRLIK